MSSGKTHLDGGKTAMTVNTCQSPGAINVPTDQGSYGSSSASEYQSFSAADAVQAKPESTWRSYLWDTLDKPKTERQFLFKLDAVLLSLASLSLFIKLLDQVNINNAFVSGMREDLSLLGNELNYMQTAFTAGYIVGEIPSNLILTWVRPSIWLPACQVAWSTLTFLLARASTPTHFYVLRFFIGLFEGGCHPGMQYIIGSWYRKDELAKRSCILQASSFVGYIVSGYLMASVHHLDGFGGLKGWQWLFIVDGIISLPIALTGFWLLPDIPGTTRAFYFSKDEAAIATRRMELEGRAGREPWTLAKIKGILRSWHLWLLSLLYALVVNAAGGVSQPTFQLWLKSQQYSVRDINIYPTVVAVVSIVSTLAYAWVSDTVCKGARWPPILFAASTSFIGYVSLAAWNIQPGWQWACYIIIGLGTGVGGLTHAWAAEITSASNEERAIVTAAMSQFASIISSWLPLLVWQVVEAPRYFKGFTTMAVLWVAIVVVSFWLRFLHKRELVKKVADTV